ncbi:MAG: amidohydrolase [Actinobacteria bacterium]|nr:amidohydrolase [Actinomycetota bacterium]
MASGDRNGEGEAWQAADIPMRWDSAGDGPGVGGAPWVDTHVHILPPRRMRGLVRWVKKFTPGFPVSEDISTEEILASLRSSGIPLFFNLVFPLWEEETEDLNRFNRDLCAGIPEAVPFGSLHIETPDKEGETRRCIEEYGFVGMKLHPYAQRFPAFGEEMRPLFRVLDEHGRPLLVHTGFDAFYGMYMDLEEMERTIRDHPRMQVVAVHALFPRFRLAHRLMEEYPNFWLDMTNTISCLRLHHHLKSQGSSLPDSASSLEVEEVEKNLPWFHRLLEDFSDRIMYGTDFPVGFGYHPALLEDLRFFGFDEGIEEDLLAGAAKNLLARCGFGHLAEKLPAPGE